VQGVETGDNKEGDGEMNISDDHDRLDLAENMHRVDVTAWEWASIVALVAVIIGVTAAAVCAWRM